MKAIAILCAALLAGCAHNEVLPPVPPLPQPKMPANVRATCEPLPPAPKRGSNMGHLYTFTGDVIALYDECAQRDRAKLEWAEKQGY